MTIEMQKKVKESRDKACFYHVERQVITRQHAEELIDRFIGVSADRRYMESLLIDLECDACAVKNIIVVIQQDRLIDFFPHTLYPSISFIPTNQVREQKS